MIASLAVASLAIGLASWASYQLGRWRTLDAARCAQAVQDGMRALDMWAESNREAFFAKVEAFANTGEIPGMQRVDFFDGERIMRVSWTGPRMNSEGGVA